MENLLTDIRYGLRTLLKKRGFTAVALATLALGIGANSAIFSVVNAVVLRPLPYRDPERLVAVWGNIHRPGLDELEASAPEVVDYQQRNTVFEHVAAYSLQGSNLTGAGEPERIQGASVTANLFPLLGVAPALGRTLLPEEDRPGSDQAVVLSHALWQRRFGGDPSVVGKTLALDGRSVSVVGVMPAGFNFPDADVELWKPAAFDAELLSENNRGSHFLNVVARLREGVSMEQGQTEIAAIAEGIRQEHADNYRSGFSAKIKPLHEEVVGGVRTALYVLLCAVGLVLLIACSNVANLTLARAAARHREIAVRAALGATRWRIIRQLLTESFLLSLLGGGLGLLLAMWGVDVLVSLAPPGTPRVGEIGLNAGVVAFTFGVSLVTGVLFGLAPALQVSRPDLNEALKESGRGSTEGPRRKRLRSLLVVSEFALALVLLVGAGLLVKSFRRIQEVSPGFDPENVLTMRLVLPKAKYEKFEQGHAFYQTLFARLRELPGVEAVGANNLLPFSGGGGSRSLLVEGQPVAPGSPHPEEQLRFITPGYFDALRVPLLQGRDIGDRDGPGAARVAVVNRAMAERYWPGQEAVGKRIAYRGIAEGGKPDWIEVVGVVGNVKHRGLELDFKPEIYVPAYQPLFEGFGMPALYVAVRSAHADPAGLAAAVRREVLAVDKDQPVAALKTMRARLAESVAQRRFNMTLLSTFALLALALASVGIYGVIAYTVAQRTHEMGVRMALGARTFDILRLVIGQGMAPALLGVAVGLVASLALTRLMSSLLFGVSATDPATFAGIAALLAGVALLACYVPARRATKVNPMVALRYE